MNKKNIIKEKFQNNQKKTITQTLKDLEVGEMYSFGIDKKDSLKSIITSVQDKAKMKFKTHCNRINSAFEITKIK